MHTLTSPLSSLPSMPPLLRVTRRILAAVLIAFCVCSGVLLYLYSEKELEHDLTQSEIRLNLLASLRAESLERWVTQQREAVSELAANTALQLYVTELQRQPEAVSRGRDAHQMVYLRNLLDASVMRGAFRSVAVSSGATGIAIFDMSHALMTSTPGFPLEALEVKRFVDTLPLAEVAMSSFIPLEVDGKRELVLAFAAPVFAVQTASNPENQVAVIVGVVAVTPHLFPLLTMPPVLEQTAETLLVSLRPESDVLEYHTPLLGMSDAVASGEQKDQASLFAIASPNRFAIASDYRSERVLATGRAIANAPWVLVQKVNYAEAMREGVSRQHTLWAAGGAMILALSGLLLGSWLHGSSERYKQLAQHYSAQHSLTRLIADYKPEALYIVDHQDRCYFANREAWRRSVVRSEPANIPLQKMLSEKRFNTFAEANARALAEGKIISYLYQEPSAEGAYLQMQIRHIPLKQLPSVHLSGEIAPGVLILEQDITELLAGRERLTDTLHTLVDTLVSLMDRRDHNASGHSVRVALLAVTLAKELRLSAVEVDTVDVAARLMNLGKMLVPSQLLTKTNPLTEEEENVLQTSLQKSADLIEGIAFDGPVRDTILQSRENLDGTGPRGMKGDRILFSAKIIRVANDFISMISPRAYRKPLSVEGALAELGKSAGTRYESSVLAVLARHLETH